MHVSEVFSALLSPQLVSPMAIEGLNGWDDLVKVDSAGVSPMGFNQAKLGSEAEGLEAMIGSDGDEDWLVELSPVDDIEDIKSVGRVPAIDGAPKEKGFLEEFFDHSYLAEADFDSFGKFAGEIVAAQTETPGSEYEINQVDCGDFILDEVESDCGVSNVGLSDCGVSNVGLSGTYLGGGGKDEKNETYLSGGGDEQNGTYLSGSEQNGIERLRCIFSEAPDPEKTEEFEEWLSNYYPVISNPVAIEPEVPFIEPNVSYIDPVAFIDQDFAYESPCSIKSMASLDDTDSPPMNGKAAAKRTTTDTPNLQHNGKFVPSQKYKMHKDYRDQKSPISMKKVEKALQYGLGKINLNNVQQSQRVFRSQKCHTTFSQPKKNDRHMPIHNGQHEDIGC